MPSLDLLRAILVFLLLLVLQTLRNVEATPTGIPVAYVVKPENAALVAIRIFALTNPELKECLDKFKQKMTKAIYDGAEEVKKLTQKKDINRLAV